MYYNVQEPWFIGRIMLCQGLLKVGSDFSLRRKPLITCIKGQIYELFLEYTKFDPLLDFASHILLALLKF